MIALMGLCLGAFVVPQIALAAATHIEQAIKETQEAIQAGSQAHHSSSLVEHADNAIDHAKLAQKEQANPHIKSGILHLRKAIKTAKGTHSSRRLNLAVKHAEKALVDFKAVP
jgi:hypothetical protein